jgi:predicted transcriptional regulator
MNNTDLFLDLYKQLEQSAVTYYGLPSDGSAVSRLERLSQFKEIRNQIKYCREVRALLTHNPKLGDDFAVTPSEAMIKTLQNVIDQVKEPPTCLDRAVKGSNILIAEPTDNVIEKMKVMKSFGFSYLPIMNNNRVVGVFGKDTVFAITLDGYDAIISDSTRFCDISSYTSVTRKDRNTFKFVSSTMLVSEAEKTVVDAFRKKIRINLLLVTETGRIDEPLLGILTPWDVMEG